MSRFESLPPHIHQNIILHFMPSLPSINNAVNRFEKETHKLLWKYLAYNLAASCRTMQQATQQSMQQKWSEANRDFKDVEWSSPAYEVISWRIVVLLGALQKTKALRLKAVAAVQDKDNIFAKPFVSPVVKRQLKSAPFKPLVPIKTEVAIKAEIKTGTKTEIKTEMKTEAFTPPRTTKNEPQIKSEPTVAGAVDVTVKKEVTIKSDYDDEPRSSPIIDKFHDLSTVSPQKGSREFSPLKRKISLESAVQHSAVVKSATRSIKKAKK